MAPDRHRYLTTGNTRVLAHRGASSKHPPGNTMAAFTAALDTGVDHLETDAQATADGHVVVYHDDRLEESTTLTGTVADHDLATLRTANYVVDGRTTDQRIVTLEEVLEEFPDAFMNIDAKTEDVIEPLTELLVRFDVRERACVASFSYRRLRTLRRRLGPRWCSAASKLEIIAVRVLAWLRLPIATQADVIQLPVSFKGITATDRRLVEACHAAGVAVHVWTIDDVEQMRRLYDIGVDAVITNVPGAANQVASDVFDR